MNAAESTKGDRPKAIQVLLVDDHPIVRDGLADAINREPDLAVVALAEDRNGALKAIEATHPRIAIVDLSLKTSSGLDLIKDIRARWPDLLVLVVSMHDESVYAERAIRAGARGYLTKQQATRDVILAIRKILEGEIYLNTVTAATLLKRIAIHPAQQQSSLKDSLTDRELQVFELIGSGLSTRDIAGRLRIDMKTVETYRLRLRDKLGLSNSSELLQNAIQWAQDTAKGVQP